MIQTVISIKYEICKSATKALMRGSSVIFPRGKNMLVSLMIVNNKSYSYYCYHGMEHKQKI